MSPEGSGSSSSTSRSFDGAGTTSPSCRSSRPQVDGDPGPGDRRLPRSRRRRSRRRTSTSRPGTRRWRRRPGPAGLARTVHFCQGYEATHPHLCSGARPDRRGLPARHSQARDLGAPRRRPLARSIPATYHVIPQAIRAASFAPAEPGPRSAEGAADGRDRRPVRSRNEGDPRRARGRRRAAARGPRRPSPPREPDAAHRRRACPLPAGRLRPEPSCRRHAGLVRGARPADPPVVRRGGLSPSASGGDGVRGSGRPDGHPVVPPDPRRRGRARTAGRRPRRWPGRRGGSSTNRSSGPAGACGRSRSPATFTIGRAVDALEVALDGILRRS